jgi:hypothetical protein
MRFRLSCRKRAHIPKYVCMYVSLNEMPTKRGAVGAGAGGPEV